MRKMALNPDEKKKDGVDQADKDAMAKKSYLMSKFADISDEGSESSHSDAD